MFFSIATQPDTRFPYNHSVGQLWFNCDAGWNESGTGFYKGYNDNYCEILVDNNRIQILHSVPRSFPLWYREKYVTNLPADNTLIRVWADDLISFDDQGNVQTNKINIDLTLPVQTLTIGEAQDKIKKILDQSLSEFYQDHTDCLTLFCSGGVDTVLLYGLLSSDSRSFTLLTNEHYELDEFTNNNQQSLKQFWGYKQIHHWTNHTWLATGSQGDEYFLRGPNAIAMLTAWHNINFLELLNKNSNCYHNKHFNKYLGLWIDTWATRHQLQEQYPTVEALHTQILNMLVNDHQHWHLGNTLTWTPFKNIEIAKILLQCPIDLLIPQFLDAQINKELISQYNPRLLKTLSQWKNYNKTENLDWFDKL